MFMYVTNQYILNTKYGREKREKKKKQWMPSKQRVTEGKDRVQSVHIA